MSSPDNRLVDDIISRFHANRFPDKVKRNFYRWLLSEDYYTAKDKAMNDLWDSLSVPADRSVYNSLEAVEAKLGMIPERNYRRPTGRRPILKAAVMAAALLLPAALVLGLFFAIDSPGSGKGYVVEAPLGRTASYELPDGSVVWLNADSRLEYPKRFRGGKREVRLEGEGFFEVARDTRKPFTVVSDHLVTEVTGTRFNVSSYDNQAHESVTVLDGGVRVLTPRGERYSLTPGTHLIHWTGHGVTETESVDAASMVSWLHNGLVFENSTIGDIMHGLRRAYNLRVLVDPSHLTGTIYSVRFVSGESLEEILAVVRKLTGVPCRMSSGTLMVGNNPVTLSNSEINPNKQFTR